MEKTYDLELSKDLYSHYIENEIGYSAICKTCKSHNASKGRILKIGPIPVFHIGDKYKQSKTRVLFLGTVAYGWDGEIPGIFVEDKSQRIQHLDQTIDYIETRISDLFDEQKMKYFSFIKHSLEETNVLGPEPLRKIALSNLIKCNLGNGEKRNHHLQKNYDFCIREEHSGNLLSDVKVLDPTHIVILSRNTNMFYRYGKIFEDQGRKVLFVHHPSSSTKGGKALFIEMVKNFISE